MLERGKEVEIGRFDNYPKKNWTERAYRVLMGGNRKLRTMKPPQLIAQLPCGERVLPETHDGRVDMGSIPRAPKEGDTRLAFTRLKYGHCGLTLEPLTRVVSWEIVQEADRQMGWSEDGEAPAVTSSIAPKLHFSNMR